MSRRQFVWSKCFTPKLSHFLCKSILGHLPTRDRLHNYGIIEGGWCSLCKSHNESLKQLFFDYSYNVQQRHMGHIENKVHAKLITLLAWKREDNILSISGLVLHVISEVTISGVDKALDIAMNDFWSASAAHAPNQTLTTNTTRMKS